MKNRIQKALLPAIFITLLAGFSPLWAQMNSPSDIDVNSFKFNRLLRLVESNYVDTVNINKLTETAIVKMLEEMDPHSVYITKDEVAAMNEPLQGNFEGIGISFNILKDTLLVTQTIPGGPSEKAGLMGGDRIVNIDGKNIAGIGLKNDDVFKMLKGKKGTQVSLEVLRKNEPSLLSFKIIRDKIPIYSLDASYMLDKETGYIKLNKFAATTMDEFREAITELKTHKVKNLILDLRGNGGGYLNAAFELSDEFLPNNKMIVYTEGVHNSRKEYKSTDEGEFQEGKLVVLINEGSASASEIVSGAVQDWDRGIIIGRRSYGKGLVQQPYMFSDGSMIRLTTAHYYTPSGRCIQKPYNEGLEVYREDFEDRITNGELFNADSIIVNDSLKYKTLTNGRTVYGGGGIVPDLFVALDTSQYFKYYNKLRSNNVVYPFVLDLVDKNRDKLTKEYPEFEKFRQKFFISDQMLDDLVAEGVKQGVEKDQQSFDFTKELIKKELKALISRDLYTRHNFWEILNSDDTTIEKALEIIKNQNEYNSHLASN